MIKVVEKATQLTRRAVLFGDGSQGLWIQQYIIEVDNEESGVTLLVQRESRDHPIVKTYSTHEDDFNSLKAALESVGYKVTLEGLDDE